MPDAPLNLEAATELLGLGPGAPAARRRQLFERKRSLLEGKLNFAPTPRLRAQYARAIDELTRAYEAVELAATEHDLDRLEPAAGESAAPHPDVSGRVLAESAFGLSGPAAPGRRRARLEYVLIPLAALTLLGIVGAVWWKTDRAKAEAARLAAESRAALERAAAEDQARREQESAAAAALAAREAEAARTRLAAEERAAARKVDAERRLARALADVDAGLASLDARLQDLDRAISSLRRAEQDLGAAGGWRLDWSRRRRSLLDSHRVWLAEFSAQHPARPPLRASRQLSESGDLEGALAAAEQALDAWELRAGEPDARRQREVGRVLLEMVASQTSWPIEAWGETAREEPAAAARFVHDLRSELAYLDAPNSRAVGADYASRLIPLRALAGPADPDVLRWLPRFSGALHLASVPSGAKVVDETGQTRGTTPVVIERLLGGRLNLTLLHAGFEAKAVAVDLEIDERQDVEIALREIVVPRPGTPFTVPDLDLPLLWLEPGTFVMGSPPNESGRAPDEPGPVRVRLTQGYWLGKYEVTQAQWLAVMGSNPSRFEDVGSGLPVETVSWKDAMEFGRRLTERERLAGRLPPGYVYTLPTEAQWEYACRGGSSSAFAGALDELAWYGANRGGRTHPVGQKRANAWGFHDMHGNVWEWCRDWYADAYPKTGDDGTLVDPSGPAMGAYKVNRGGSWRSPAASCRSAFRHWLSQNDRGNGLGLRLALVREP